MARSRKETVRRMLEKKVSSFIQFGFQFGLLTCLATQSTPVLADSIETDSLINEIRFSIGMVVGFSNESAYSKLACGGLEVNSTNCQGPPQAGILGTITNFVNKLPTVAQNGGISSCSDAPSSGSVTGVDATGKSYTLTFATPTHKVPAAWLHGGDTFSHRVTFSGSLNLGGTKDVPLNIAAEFNCGDSPAMYVAVGMPMVDSTTGAAQFPGYSYNRDIVLYNGPIDSTHNGIELYMAEHTRNEANTVRTADLIRIVHNKATNGVQLWGVISSNPSGSSGNLVGRLFVNGYATGMASFRYDGKFGTSGANNSIPASASDSTSTDMTTVTAYDFNTVLTGLTDGLAVQKQACLTLAAGGASTDPTSNVLCSGLSISAPTDAPTLSSTGAFTPNWVVVTMPDLLEQLGDAGPKS